jgi:hypothetical protein
MTDKNEMMRCLGEKVEAELTALQEAMNASKDASDDFKKEYVRRIDRLKDMNFNFTSKYYDNGII